MFSRKIEQLDGPILLSSYVLMIKI